MNKLYANNLPISNELKWKQFNLDSKLVPSIYNPQGLKDEYKPTQDELIKIVMRLQERIKNQDEQIKEMRDLLYTEKERDINDGWIFVNPNNSF
jgi:hypothetical protein